MNYIRTIFNQLYENIGKKPILVLYGARQVGKTTLIKSILARFSNTLYLQGDDPKDAMLLEHRSAKELSGLVSGYELVVIDEAQRVKDIGVTLKLIADNVKQVRVIATGSSSFELANKLNEPLTGRNRKFYLYPLSIKEVVAAYGKLQVNKELDSYMTFGMYPAIVNAISREEKATLIRELAGDYLFKDLFLFGGIRNPFAFEKLVKLLALRIGSEISYTELAKEVGVSRDTIYNYVNLLEQAFIIFRLTPLYTNKTKEINKSHKIYFYDIGIRNALIGNSDPIEIRPDKGAIFENFFIAEKIKERAYSMHSGYMHFWRNRQGSEVDFVESTGGPQGYLEKSVSDSSSVTEIFAYECKWKEKNSAPVSFKTSYPHAHFECITTENIVEHFV
ncbi:ATP-binding protein [Candidatus Peregrinibacteria bacterium]|nr:ATP-binding protein [Candidatus Peregrinibacteria bacterium]